MSVRFAPSPTGKFHVGNLRTAWISHAFSRFLRSPWVIRFEDIDQPRVVPEAAQWQLDDLRELGMIPDRVLVQSDRRERHEELFRDAVAAGQIYPCTCSRKELNQELHSIASAPHGDTPLYSGRCRNPENRATQKAAKTSHPTLSWRFRNPENEEGTLDFIVARTDPNGGAFTPGYHWACAIDDFDERHALLVRASDLSQASRLQSRIFSWLAERERCQRSYPAVFHAALVTADDGSRLEKRTRGVTLAELVKTGTSPQGLIERFSSRFDSRLLSEFAPGKIFGEPRERLSLREIGVFTGQN